MTESEKLIMRAIIALHMEIKTSILGLLSSECRKETCDSLDKLFWGIITDSKRSKELNQWLDEIMEAKL